MRARWADFEYRADLGSAPVSMLLYWVASSIQCRSSKITISGWLSYSRSSIRVIASRIEFWIEYGLAGAMARNARMIYGSRNRRYTTTTLSRSITEENA